MKNSIISAVTSAGMFMALSSHTFADPLDIVDQMIPILEQDFSEGLNKYNGRTGLWSTESPRGGLITNAKETVFLDPDVPDVPWDVTPSTLTVTSDGLSVRTVRIPDAALKSVRQKMQANGQAARAEGIKYATGRITTAETWAQVYGWFEIEAQIPRGKGRWPAFWLNFAGPGWPPEIDIFEAYGEGIARPTPKDGRFNTAVLFDQLDEARQPVHDVDVVNKYERDPQKRKPRSKERAGRLIYTFSRHNFETELDADIYGRVNTYAALWTDSEVIFYFGPDRDSLKEIYRTPTPEDVHDPMYVLANDQFTARGGIWDADADIDAVLNPGNDFLIRSISVRAFQPEMIIELDAGQSAFVDDSTVVNDTAGNDVIAPGEGFDVINLSTGADEIRVSKGRQGKLIEGFGPDDRLILDGFTFRDSSDAYGRLTQVGDDVWLSSGADPFWPQSIIFRNARVEDFDPSQIVSRWPVERNIWGTRLDLVNKSQGDDDGDGVMTASEDGSWMNDRGQAIQLYGDLGPGRYLLSHPNTQVIEPTDGSVDTIIAWGTRSLPPNVERGILRGRKGRLMGSSSSDRLEAEGTGGELTGGPGDDLYVIHPKALDTAILIEAAAGHDRLRGYNKSHSVIFAPSLLAQASQWRWEATDEGLLITFNEKQSLLIEGVGMATRDDLIDSD
ncbi:MAG: family 16 glycosylhydrolase [Pseudomonadota bacterium]